MTLPPNFVLPATGLSAKATLNNKTAQIQWQTETEVNTNNFIVERSLDGIDYSEISTVKAIGNSLVKSEYQYPDNLSSVTQKTIYYRIKQIDIDGKIAYSNIVPLKLVASLKIDVWPNPVVNNVTISINSPSKDLVTLSLYDMNGRLVKTSQQSLATGNNQLQVNGFDVLPSGVYTLQLAGALLQKSFKLIKNK
jgi:hypothetical protein